MGHDYLIVGAGITGCSMARVLADAGRKVLIIDKRGHIGGNCYDEYDAHGVLVHKYGPHIFHTNIKEVWDFLSRFTEWRLYQHRVKAFVDGMLVSVPVNLNTMAGLFNREFTAEQMEEFVDSLRLRIDEPRNAKEAVLMRMGELLYEKLFKNYTLKQWGIPAEKLAAAVTQRIPLRFSGDDRYFSDTYQGMPRYGYSSLFGKMLDHRNIHILLQTGFDDMPPGMRGDRVIYTGPIDEYYGFCFGRLGYRSVHFDFETFNIESYQDYAVINYPNDYDFTRITEYKKLTGQEAVNTTISREYPASEGEPYYPMPTEENQVLYGKYMKKSGREKRIAFIGRLGAYKYLNMDAACLEGMKKAKEMLDAR